MAMKLLIIQGSTRSPSNTAGISKWAKATIESLANGVNTELIDLAHLSLPWDIDPVIPQGHPSSQGSGVLAESYVDPKIQAWSRTISACDAVLIITPQYNWSVPAPLKNAIDHLYHEWTNKPVGLFTFGGHGGTKCCETLKLIFQGGLNARVAEKVINANLPREYIRTNQRVKGDDEFLASYQQDLGSVVQELAALVKASPK
ncbi:flavo protein [Myriangium duriaei CBS 260.36]|uniref:Flavo protein n=1 Tax=Myriangium duriaei CBS 260.36 TaxID=1168546 RepID=A0A9P4J8N3_9PEZI|nr:flavo protein [Myriangium duriaei CBS 260.36]